MKMDSTMEKNANEETTTMEEIANEETTTAEVTSLKRKAIDREQIFGSLKQREHRIHIFVPKTALWNDLHNIFSKYGRVIKVSVPDGKGAELNRGYGMVTYENKEDMEAALNSTDSLHGQKLIVKKSFEKDDVKHARMEANKSLPSKKMKNRDDQGTIVFIAPLNHKTKIDRLQDTFGQFGDLKRIYLPLRRNHVDNIGYGKIIFKDEAGAERALAAATIEIDGVSVTIQRNKHAASEDTTGDETTTPADEHAASEDTTGDGTTTPADEAQTTEANPTNIITLTGINPVTNKKDVMQVFEKYGKINRILLVKRNKILKSIQVIFADNKSTRAIKTEGPIVMRGSTIKINFTDANNDTCIPHYMPQNEIFVGNLKFEWCVQDLKDYFSTFGRICNIDMPMDKVLKCNKGYAIISFKNEEGAIAVLKHCFPHKIQSWQMKVIGRMDFVDTTEQKKLAQKMKKRYDHVTTVRMQDMAKKKEHKDLRIAVMGIDTPDIDWLVKSTVCSVNYEDEGDDE